MTTTTPTRAHTCTHGHSADNERNEGTVFIGGTVFIEEFGANLAHKYPRDGGFGSLAHALSTLATVVCLAAFFPEVYHILYSRQSLLTPMDVDDPEKLKATFLAVSVFCTVGACMLPDLDNSNSRAESALGFLGNTVSEAFRKFAFVVQSTIRMERDDVSPNVHRGFWHTPLGALTLSAPVYFAGLKANGEYDNPATIFLIVTVFLLSYLSFTALLHDSIKNKSGAMVKLSPYILAALISGVLLLSGQNVYQYSYPICFSIFFGMMLHVFGDCHTKSGAPIFSPFTAITRKKVWWTTRFFKLESGGEFEKDVLVKLYGLAAFAGIVGILVLRF